LFLAELARCVSPHFFAQPIVTQLISSIDARACILEVTIQADRNPWRLAANPASGTHMFTAFLALLPFRDLFTQILGIFLALGAQLCSIRFQRCSRAHLGSAQVSPKAEFSDEQQLNSSTAQGKTNAKTTVHRYRGCWVHYWFKFTLRNCCPRARSSTKRLQWYNGASPLFAWYLYRQQYLR